MARSTKIKLQSSICTDTPIGADLFQLGDDGARHLQNTGIERNGGLTPIYEKETTFPTAGLQSLITKSGDVLQVDASHNIRINDSVIGNVGPYAVSQRGVLKGYSDAAWTAGNTIIAIAKIGQTIKVDEINPSTMAVINTRSTTFTMPSVVITNIVLVKYIGMNFADSLTFILSNNQIAYSLVEANAPAIAIVGSETWTGRTITADAVWRSVCWSPQLLLFCAVGRWASTNCAATSPDGINWTLRAIGTMNWMSVCWSPQLLLFCAVADQGQASTSPDGINWTPRTIEAPVNAWFSVCWSPQKSLFCAVGAGANHYAATSPDGINWTTRTLEANTWNSVCWSIEKSLFVAVGSGATHYVATSPDGTTWTPGTLEANTWNSVTWSSQLTLFVAVGAGGTHYAATSPDGTTWTPRTLSAITWRSVIWVPQLSTFVAVGGTQNAAYSSDGINWTAATSLPTGAWYGVAWSSQLNLLVAISSSTVYAATGQNTILASDLCWKFAANKFIIGNQGVGAFGIGDIAGTITAIADATWCVIDIFAGTAYSRAILTFPVKKNASNLLSGIGEVGYNQSGTYTATPTYYGVALAAVTVAFGNNVCGPGYAEATFTRSDTGTAIFYYQAPIMQHNPGQWFDYQQSQTQTLCNGYGRLSDFNGNTLGNTAGVRIMMELGIPTTITAGVIAQDASYDALGVPITNVGEFDEFFMPHVIDNGSTRLNCIYRYNGVLFFFVIASGITNTLQAVSDNIYMVNCLSPVNAIDVANRTLNLGVNDYNGRILFRSTAAIIATIKCVGIIQTPYSNSSDTSDKLITQTFSTTTDIIPGIELPSFVDRAVLDYGVNIYLADLYSVTYQSFSITYTNPAQVGVLYVPDTRIPFAMGYTFYVHAMQTEIETVFSGVGVAGSANINFDYLGYEIGNDTPGQFKSFILFGQEYLFDGNNIWLALFNGSLFSGKGNAPIAIATGMILIASSPTEIFFLSAFDNSIYSFSGGRSLTKVSRMNQEDTILSGVFNVRDDTLLLNCTNSFIWIRDGIASKNTKKSNQTGITVYDTQAGIFIANNTLSWQYTFYALASSTVVPFVWQSGYFGVTENKLGIFSAFIPTIYKADKTPVSVIFTIDGFDTDGEWHEEQPFNITPGDWTPLGFYRPRIVPQHTLGLALSIGMRTSNYAVLNEVVAEFTPSVSATPAASRSK